MKFYGDVGQYLELNPKAGIGAALLLDAAAYHGENKVWSAGFTTTAIELRSLADWLENFWDPCAPAILGGTLSFVYSHREHIGEGYYTIEAEGETILRGYEHLGSSNVARAQELRQLAG